MKTELLFDMGCVSVLTKGTSSMDFEGSFKTKEL